ncbi:MAG: UPF0149 family protein [Pseudomonadota bacterium]
MNTITTDEINNILQKSETGMLAEELHGLICGIICADTEHDGETKWRRLVFDNAQVDASLVALFDQSREQLSSEQFDFQLLLPEEDETLECRVEALARWSDSFLSGLGLGGMDEAEMDRLTKNSDLGETLDDLIAISQVSYEPPDDADDSENDYTEIVEYVRVAVMSVFIELRLQATKTGNKENNDE